MHTVARSMGAASWDTAQKRSLSGAAAEFMCKAYDLIAGRAMRDTREGWRFKRVTDKLARDIERGVIVAADVAKGERSYWRRTGAVAYRLP